jgi:hypothetical protein
MLTIFTSLLFFTNTIINYLLGYPIYATLFAILASVSAVHNHIKSHSTYCLDQLALITVVIYGGLVAIKKNSLGLYSNIQYFAIIALFLTCLCLYNIGKEYECFIFAKDPIEAANYHIFMHMCAIYGHYAIVF